MFLYDTVSFVIQTRNFQLNRPPHPGERTPVGIRLAEFIPRHWIMCRASRNTQAFSLGDVDGREADVVSNVRRVVERSDGTSMEGEW